MYEQMTNILLQMLNHAASIFFNNLLPKVGVEGAAEKAAGTVPASTVYVTLIVLAGLGIVFGIALAIVAARFVRESRFPRSSRSARPCPAQTAGPADSPVAWDTLKRSWATPMSR